MRPVRDRSPGQPPVVGHRGFAMPFYVGGAGRMDASPINSGGASDAAVKRIATRSPTRLLPGLPQGRFGNRRVLHCEPARRFSRDVNHARVVHDASCENCRRARSRLNPVRAVLHLKTRHSGKLQAGIQGGLSLACPSGRIPVSAGMTEDGEVSPATEGPRRKTIAKNPGSAAPGVFRFLALLQPARPPS